MDDKTIHGEIARKCGKDNAVLGYRINTDTNEIEYYVDSFIGGKYKKRAFARYADARAYFDFPQDEPAKTEVRKLFDPPESYEDYLLTHHESEVAK